MLPYRVSNPGPLTYESGALPIALRGPAVSDAISCPLHNLKTLWYIIMIPYSYTEQVLMMCRGTQKATLALIFSKLFPLDCFKCNFVSAP